MLTDGKIILRAPEPTDVDMLYIWENDPELWRVGLTSAPISRMQLKEYIDTYTGDIYVSGQLRFVIVDSLSGESVGTIDITDYDGRHRRAMVGVFVESMNRRRGIALAALNLAYHYCKTTLGLHQLWTMVGEDNRASRNLFEKAGYSACGRLRSWLRSGESYSDVLMYQKLCVE